MPEDIKMTLANLLRDKQQALEDAEAALGQSARSMTRMLMDLDEFTLDGFRAVCEDIERQYPRVQELRADLKKIKAQML